MTTCQTFVFDFVTSLHNNKLAHLLHNTHQHKHNHAHCHNKWQQQQQHRQRRTKVCKESNTSHVLTTRCRAVGCGWWRLFGGQGPRGSAYMECGWWSFLAALSAIFDDCGTGGFPPPPNNHPPPI